MTDVAGRAAGEDDRVVASAHDRMAERLPYEPGSATDDNTHSL